MSTVTRWILAVAAIGGAIACFIGAAVTCAGCGPSLQEQEMVAAYAGDQIECVNLATSRDQADACRLAVRMYWCGSNGPLRGLGACIFLSSADGGAHP